MLPGTLEVCTECQKLRAFRLAQRRRPLSRLHLLELRLKFADCQQPFIPPTLQLGRNGSVRRIHQIVLLLSSIALIASLLDSKLDLSSTIVRLGIVRLDRLERGLHPQWLKQS